MNTKWCQIEIFVRKYFVETRFNNVKIHLISENPKSHSAPFQFLFICLGLPISCMHGWVYLKSQGWYFSPVLSNSKQNLIVHDYQSGKVQLHLNLLQGDLDVTTLK
jgi:hypothetical protein